MAQLFNDIYIIYFPIFPSYAFLLSAFEVFSILGQLVTTGSTNPTCEIQVVIDPRSRRHDRRRRRHRTLITLQSLSLSIVSDLSSFTWSAGYSLTWGGIEEESNVLVNVVLTFDLKVSGSNESHCGDSEEVNLTWEFFKVYHFPFLI